LAGSKRSNDTLEFRRQIRDLMGFHVAHSPRNVLTPTQRTIDHDEIGTAALCASNLDLEIG
jgi:hypothetical protein